MPRVLAYTPRWLSAPSPGSRLLDPDGLNSSAKRLAKLSESGPYKILAYRGTEVFAAVGNELRWTDLLLLKEMEEREAERRGRGRSGGKQQQEEEDIRPFRTLKLGISRPITQLAVSPDGSMIAVATAHTVAVAPIPSSAELMNPDTGSVVTTRTPFTIGPMAHVREASPLKSILWHPLSANHNCLVTVTESAEVRLWEINAENTFSSAEEPALSIDLNKLIAAETTEDEVHARPYSKGQTYSADGIQVAAACFGANGESLSGWADMTLYVTTLEGEVYALCPLLPSKWRYDPGVLHTLSLEVAAKRSALGPDATEQEVLSVEQLSRWMDHVESQNPQELVRSSTREPITALNRPTKPDAKPKLQGPFILEDETLEDDEDITDIYVIGLRSTSQSDEESEDDFPLDEEGTDLPASVICLASNRGSVHVTMNLDGVEPQWLPTPAQFDGLSTDSDDTVKVLAVLESITVPESTSRVCLSPDLHSPHAFFMTYDQGVNYVSLHWLPKLINELAEPAESGTSLRINSILDTAESLIEKILTFDTAQLVGQTNPIAAAIIIQDSDLGYFLLSGAHQLPWAVTFDEPKIAPSRIFHPSAALSSLNLPEARPAYVPSPLFKIPSSLLPVISDQVPARRRRLLAEPVILSRATLDVFTEAHRVLSSESHNLGVAVADLFRRCERLRDELADQVERVAELHARVEHLADEEEVSFSSDADGHDDDDARATSRSAERLAARLDDARARQRELVDRAERLRRKLDGTARPLSDREKAFAADVQRFSAAVGDGSKFRTRLAEATRYKDELVPEARGAAERAEQGETEKRKPAEEAREREEAARLAARVPAEVRRQRRREVEELLERQEALVEAAREKLERMGAVSA